MKKRKSIKIASIAIGVVLVGMFLFALPLLGADKSSNVQSASVTTVMAEEAMVSNDTDNVQEEVVDKNDVNGVEEANESSDIKEADANLPGGGHEDLDSAEGEIDHQFEGVE